MPELPEVETTRRGIEPWVLNANFSGWQVRNASLRWPVEIPTELKHQVVRSVLRRGKYILICTDVGTLIIHLGMSGSLRVIDPRQTAQKHDHVDLIFTPPPGAKTLPATHSFSSNTPPKTAAGTEVRNIALRFNDPRRFGCILFQAGGDAEQHVLLRNLGVEPLGNEFTGKLLHERSRGRKVAVKNFIMDSKIVVGVGNIYAAEALFTAGLRPTTQAGRVPLWLYERLAQAIVEVLARSVRQGGTTLRDFVGSDGAPGYFKQQLNVYGRQDMPCKRCSTTLKLIILGQRSSVYCPKCQSSQGFRRQQ